MFPVRSSGPIRQFWLCALALLSLASAAALRATTVVPPEFGAMVNGSDFIVRAVVKRTAAELRAGPRGPKIVTRVEFTVLETVAGSAPDQLVLEFLGGRVGDRELQVGGMPRFEVGDEDILFVSGNGRTICPLYAMQHGRFPVVTDTASGRKHVARADGAPLHATGQSATPLAEDHSGPHRSAAVGALTPEDFIAEIRATRQVRATR